MDKFSSSWQSLKDKFGISTTPKLHIILDHLEDYFNETNRTLLRTSDEVVENMHQFVFKRLMKGYNVKDISNLSHGDKLYNLARQMNTYNLDDKLMRPVNV